MTSLTPSRLGGSNIESRSVAGSGTVWNLALSRTAPTDGITHMMTIYFMHYNFVRIHQTLKVTPAMAAGVTSKLWEMSDMVRVLEDWEAKQ
jgi:hypothetical protein